MINSIISENLETKGGNTAIVDGQFRATYSELRNIISSLSDYLSGAGIKKGDRVCLYLPNSAEFVAGFFAITNIGAVCVPVNSKYKPAELDHYISHSGAKYVLTSNSLLGSVKDTGREIKTITVKGESSG